MHRFLFSPKRPVLQLLTLPALVLTVVALGCGSNAPENNANGGAGGGTTSPPTETPGDAGAPPVTRDGGSTVTPVIDAGTPTPVVDAGSAYRYGSCLQATQCLQSASCYRSSCSSSCLNDADPDVRDETTALLACVERNNCTNNLQCIGQNCVSEASACGMAGQGTASCAQTMVCALGCDRSDFACYGGCLGSASPDAQQKVRALIGCAMQSSCGQDMACIQRECSAEISACMSS